MAGRPSPRLSHACLALVVCVSAFACEDRTEPIDREDVRALLTVAHLDDQTLALVREAEAAAKIGRNDLAAARLEAARSAAGRAVEAADALALRTRGGRAAQAELGGILARRSEGIDIYAEAVKSKLDLRRIDALRIAREVEMALVQWERTVRGK